MKPPQYRNIDDYSSSFPGDIREVPRTNKTDHRDAVPAAKEAIKYIMPAFALNNNLVYFAACKHRIGFYPMSTEVFEF